MQEARGPASQPPPPAQMYLHHRVWKWGLVKLHRQFHPGQEAYVSSNN
jgi:hypothetical protein